ncbi:MAG: type II secretion system F family protein [Lachnospiraceae bacterium]|nr:type II secretion system F family protein [Lachnospiraceae bacterium]
MANYRYKAQTAEGKIVYGKMLATDEQDLHNRLKMKQLMLVEAKGETEKKYYKPFSAKTLAEYSRQIGTLLRSGITLVRALQMLCEDEAATSYEKAVYGTITANVMQGVPFSEAMEKLGGVFPPLMINMFRASESTGNMDGTALKIADQYSKEDRLNAKVKNATTYPKILAFIIVVVVAIIFGYVMPQFEELFESMPVLPLATRIMMWISGFVKNNLIGIIIFCVAVYAAIYFMQKIPGIKYVLDRAKVHFPKFGRLMKVIYTARFARTLSSLYSSGIPIITCLQIARNTIGNSYIEKQFDQVIADTQAGETLSGSLSKVDGFIGKMISSIKVGEEAGSLDTMLNSVADDMEFESERAIGQMVAMLEPVMIIIMALIVGFIMISVITPIYQSYSFIGAQS